MAAAAAAAAAPAQVVLLGEHEVAFGRVIKIAGLKRLGLGRGHTCIKVTPGLVGRILSGILLLLIFYYFL
jgi:hypothetical protein